MADPLQQPLTFPFSGRTAPNRMLKAAMTERLATWDHTARSVSGIPTDGHNQLYARWASGGWGIVLTGNIMVDANHLEYPGNMIIPADAPTSGPRFDAFKALATAAKRANKDSLLIAQISHPGRRVDPRTQSDPVTASADPPTEQPDPAASQGAAPKSPAPHAATPAELDAIVAAFAHAAAYLAAAGFDGVQLHAAHGYLLSQFLSRATNHRTDAHGGPLPNRARLLLAVAAAIRAATPPSFVLAAKLNALEFGPAAITPADAAATAALLSAARVDWLELSGDIAEAAALAHADPATANVEAYFLAAAQPLVPAAAPTPVFVTGGLRSAAAMRAACATVAGVGLGRPAAQEPRLPRALFAGRAAGALMQGFGDELRTTLVVAGTQIKQIAHGEDPLDGADGRNVATVLGRMDRYVRDGAEDVSGERVRMFPVEGLVGRPDGEGIGGGV